MSVDRQQKKILEEQFNRHTGMNCQDAVKMCFQGCFGPGHLIENREKAYQYFMEEFQNVSEGEGVLYEEISPEFVRINMAPYKKGNLPAEWLFQMFFLTANAKKENSDNFTTYLNLVRELAIEGKATFSADEWDAYIENYRRDGGGAVSHSDNYRKQEMPHYRVVSKKYVKILPILGLMAKRQQSRKKATVLDYPVDEDGELVAVPIISDVDEILVLVIEGRAASGKSTVAKLVSEVVDGAIVEMDHFFLPPLLRKTERLREYGGNVHYEYFMESVLPNLKEQKPFSYVAFDCKIMQPSQTIEVAAKPWRIVEGAYSMHPKFSDYGDVKVFMDVDADEQIRRIRSRNGEEMLKKFREQWIPLEEAFFFHYKLEEKADVVLAIDVE